jgi:hypothetical protein
MAQRDQRNFSKYEVTVRGKVVHGGITTDLDRRAREHLRTWPGATVAKIGRQTTKDGARRWERENGYAETPMWRAPVNDHLASPGTVRQ